MKNYNHSPLPFQGQKRNFTKVFRESLNEFSDNSIFIDLFGGSGLLSHSVKQMRPDARVIFNDYDWFILRLNAINQTNELRSDIIAITKDMEKHAHITGKSREDIINLIRLREQKGEYIDCITLSSWLLFSGLNKTTVSDIIKEEFYNGVIKHPYQADGYLEGVEIEHVDYQVLFSRYKDMPNVCFLVDPPYLSTDCSTYKSSWKLSQYLDVLKTLKGTSYFYFTSSKSPIIELCDWLELNMHIESPFSGAVKKEFNASINYSSKYTDIMLYKKAS